MVRFHLAEIVKLCASKVPFETDEGECPPVLSVSSFWKPWLLLEEVLHNEKEEEPLPHGRDYLIVSVSK
ncbi:unnamed protein product [Phytomonas sp. EM1]|nr:unnamed protein product [Phytomonas sp. EM1]|eukprot:CCW64593.1 unnamed protein product [Phytomonas sp. isolate EM1]